MKKKQAEQSQKMQRMVTITGIAVVGLVVLYIAISALTPEPTPELQSIPDNIDLDLDNQPVFGSEHAPVQVIEFGDYMCGHCKSFHEEVFESLKEEYFLIGKAAFYFINRPILGESSQLAAQASECVHELAPNAFWSFHDAMYAQQSNYIQRQPNSQTLAQLAVRQAGASVSSSELQQCIDERQLQVRVTQDEVIATSASVYSTPIILVNGKMMPTYSLSVVKQAIEDELQRSATTAR